MVPVRYAMWLLLGVPHVTLHAIRQGLPLFINFIAEDLGCSTADKAFLLGAFYPGYCVAMLPSGMVVKGVGAKRLLGLGLGGTAALLALLPLSAGSGGARASGRALWQLWAVMCAMGALSAPLMPASSVIQQVCGPSSGFFWQLPPPHCRHQRMWLRRSGCRRGSGRSGRGPSKSRCSA